MEFKMHKGSTAPMKKMHKNVKHNINASSETSPCAPFAQFVKKKDKKSNQMSGMFIKKSKAKSFKQNSDKKLLQQSAIEPVDEMYPTLSEKQHKKWKKSKNFSLNKMQTDLVSKMTNSASQEHSDSNYTKFSWTKSWTNSNKSLESISKITHGVSSGKQLNVFGKQKQKLKNNDSDAGEMCKSSFLNQEAVKDRCRTSQDDVIILGEQIWDKNTENLKSGLKKIRRKGKLIKSKPGLSFQDSNDESRPCKRLKKSEEMQVSEFNILPVEGKNATSSGKVISSLISKATKHENDIISELGKKKKRKRSHSENSIEVLHDADELSGGGSFKKVAANVLIHHENEQEKNFKSHMILSNKKVAVEKTRKKGKRKVLQKKGLHQDKHSGSEEKNEDVNVGVLANMEAVTHDGRTSYEEKYQNRKKQRKELLSGETNPISSAKESSNGHNNHDESFALDYEGSEKIKQKKKKKKNLKNSFSDIMEDNSGNMIGPVLGGSTSDTSSKVLKNTSIGEEVNKKVKTLSSDFIELPKKKMRGFEGREDTPERLRRTVFVGNLPLSVGRKVLYMLFQNIGKIESVRLRSAVAAKPSVPKRVALIKKEFHEQSNSVNAYVVFRSFEDAEKALVLNKTVVQGHHIRVDLFNNSKAHDNKRSVFVGNLSYNTSDENLWEAFGECGSIEAVRVVRDSTTGIGKGFGFVLFEKSDSVQKALLLNETEYNGRKIRVKLVEKGNKLKDRSSERRQNIDGKMEKKSGQKTGWRAAGQKKTKKKLIKKKKRAQNKKRIASILAH